MDSNRVKHLRTARLRAGAAWVGIAWLALWLTASAVMGLRQNSMPLFLSHSLGAPSLAAPFGFDVFGGDLLEVTLLSCFRSASFGAFVTALSCLLAMTLGNAMALARPPLRWSIARFLDAILAFPPLLFAFGWAAIRGPGWGTLLFALLIGSAPGLTRLVSEQAREILAQDFILASRSLGAGPGRIFFCHLLPAAVSICLIKAPGLFAQALLGEATLSFLGIGAPVGKETWGSLLLQGRDYLVEAPHIAAVTGIPLILTILALQLISERFSALKKSAKLLPKKQP